MTVEGWDLVVRTEDTAECGGVACTDPDAVPTHNDIEICFIINFAFLPPLPYTLSFCCLSCIYMNITTYVLASTTSSTSVVVELVSV